MIALNQILLPIDFSPQCRAATGYALELAKTFDAGLHLLHVIELPTSIAYLPAFGGYVPSNEELEAYADAGLSSWLDAEDSESVHVQLHKTFGSPITQIVARAKELGIALIVMGTHGRSFVPHLLMGSVAENVVRTAPCPVLTVRPHHSVSPDVPSATGERNDVS